MIEAVFFDMDNTLVNTEWAAAKAVRIVVESFGKTYEDADEQNVIGLPWKTIFEETVTKYFLPVDPDTLKRRILGEKWKLMAKDPHILPGAREAVSLCAERWPVAVVSGSYADEVEDTLRQLDLLSRIRFFIANEDVDPGKPSPDPYLEAARRLDASPSACLVFEDSVMGIRSATSAGMYCVAVEFANDFKQSLGEAHEIIPSLENVNADWLAEVEKRMGARS